MVPRGRRDAQRVRNPEASAGCTGPSSALLPVAGVTTSVPSSGKFLAQKVSTSRGPSASSSSTPSNSRIPMRLVTIDITPK